MAAALGSILPQLNAPTAQASGLPNEAYTTAEFLELEYARLFSQTWTCIGEACTVAEPGEVRPVDLVGRPLLLVRDERGEVAVFHNVCSHRGNQLVWEPGKTKGGIRCPYHSWTYALNGTLRGTPHIGGPGRHETEGFDRAAHSLRRVRSAVWLDLVFVDMSGNAAPFEEHIAPLAERLYGFADPEQYGRLRPADTHGTLELDIHANWKLVIENNLESYHLPWVHPDLNSYSRLEDHYQFYGGDLFAGQGSTVYDPVYRNGAALPLMAGWPNKVAEYPTLFPNVFVGVHADQVWTMVISPLAPDRSRERLRLYYVEEGASGTDYEGSRRDTLAAWEKIFREDVGVVQGMQRGRHSPAFQGGVFSAAMDQPTHHFHKWVGNRVAS